MSWTNSTTSARYSTCKRVLKFFKNCTKDNTIKSKLFWSTFLCLIYYFLIILDWVEKQCKISYIFDHRAWLSITKFSKIWHNWLWHLHSLQYLLNHHQLNRVKQCKRLCSATLRSSRKSSFIANFLSFITSNNTTTTIINTFCEEK